MFNIISWITPYLYTQYKCVHWSSFVWNMCLCVCVCAWLSLSFPAELMGGENDTHSGAESTRHLEVVRGGQKRVGKKLQRPNNPTVSRWPTETQHNSDTNAKACYVASSIRGRLVYGWNYSAKEFREGVKLKRDFRCVFWSPIYATEKHCRDQILLCGTK